MSEKDVQQEEWFVTVVKREDIVCRSKRLDQVERQEDLFMDTVGGGEKAWLAWVLLCGVKVNFKLDTGAEVTAISDETFKRLSCRAMLQKSSKVLYDPGQQPLEVMGQFTSNMVYNGLQSEQVVFVMKGLRRN